MTLPGQADEDQIEANLHDGVLTVRVPKAAGPTAADRGQGGLLSVGTTARRQPAAPGWRRVGQSLVRELSFRDFDQAFAFLGVAPAAEDHLRRPDMCIFDFNRVRLPIANPNHAG